MKVICISNNWENPEMPSLEIGKEYNTDGEAIEPFSRELHFSLAEVPGLAWNGQRWYYHHKHFAALSEISETEFERNYNKELA